MYIVVCCQWCGVLKCVELIVFVGVHHADIRFCNNVCVLFAGLLVSELAGGVVVWLGVTRGGKPGNNVHTTMADLWWVKQRTVRLVHAPSSTGRNKAMG